MTPPRHVPKYKQGHTCQPLELNNRECLGCQVMMEHEHWCPEYFKASVPQGGHAWICTMWRCPEVGIWLTCSYHELTVEAREALDNSAVQHEIGLTKSWAEVRTQIIS